MRNESNIQNESSSNIRQKAIRGVIWSAAQRYGDRAISFVVMLVLARLLSPTAFGLVALALVFISFAQIFIDQGFGDAVVQSPQVDQTLLNTAFWTNITTGLLVMIISISFSQTIADFYKEPQLKQIIRWLSISFVFSALSSVQEAILRRKLNFRSLAIRSLIATFVSGIIAVGLAALGAGVWSLVVKTIMFSFISILVLWGISNWRPGFSTSMDSFKRLYSYGINIVGAHFVDFFSRRSGDLLIGFYLGTTLLGYYSLAYALLIVVTEILVVVPNAVIFPAFSHIKNDKLRLQSSVYETTQIISTISIPFFACIIILAPDIVHLLYGSQWNESVPVVQVLMLVGIVHSAFYFFGSLLKAVGKPQWRFAMLSITAILNIVGFAIAVQWGIVAVAASYVFTGYLVAPLYLVLVKRAINLDIKIYLKQYAPATVCTILMSAVVFTVRFLLQPILGPIFHLIVIIPLGVSIYLICLFAFARPVLYKVLNLAIEITPRATFLFRWVPGYTRGE